MPLFQGLHLSGAPKAQPQRAPHFPGQAESGRWLLVWHRKIAVVVEDLDTVGNILLLGIRKGGGRLGQSDCTGLGIVRVESEVQGQLTGSLKTAKVKQAGSEVHPQQL